MKKILILLASLLTLTGCVTIKDEPIEDKPKEQPKEEIKEDAPKYETVWDWHDDGEMPLSKWTKSEMLSAYEDICKEYDLNQFDLSKVKVSVLKDKLLKHSSWHHTSNRFNKTHFYEVNIDFCEELNQDKVDEMVAFKEFKIETVPTIEKWEVEYLTWAGTRKHPKAERHTEVVDRDYDKGYVITKNGKKMTSANGFSFIKKVEEK